MELDFGGNMSAFAHLPPKEDFINLAQHLRTRSNLEIQPCTTPTIYTSNQTTKPTEPKLTFSFSSAHSPAVSGRSRTCRRSLPSPAVPRVTKCLNTVNPFSLSFNDLNTWRAQRTKKLKLPESCFILTLAALSLRIAEWRMASDHGGFVCDYRWMMGMAKVGSLPL